MASGKVSPASAGDAGSIPGSGRSPQRRKWQPTPVLLPGRSLGERSLVGYSPWGRKRVRHDLVTKQQRTSWQLVFHEDSSSATSRLTGSRVVPGDSFLSFLVEKRDTFKRL